MKHKKRIFKIAGIAIAAVIFLIVAGAFLFSHFADKKLKDSKLGSFELKSNKVETNLFRRQITLTDAQLSATGSENTITIPKARIRGIKLLHTIFSNELVVKEFTVDGPTINFYKKGNKKTETDSTAASGKSGKKRIIVIKHLEIPGLQFNYLMGTADKPDTIFSTHLDLNVWKLNTDSASSGYSTSAFNFERIKLFAEKGKLKVRNGLFYLSFDKLNFDTKNPALTVSSAKFASPYSRYEIGEQRGVETNWYNINIDSIQLNQIEISKLLQDTALVIGQTNIKNIEADIFRDKHLPFPEKKPDTKLPSVLVQSIPIGFHNDSLIIQNANIKYEERGKNSEEAGTVSFNSLYAKFLNVSNIDSLKTAPMTLSANAEVMGAATLNADFTFTAPGASEPSTVTGTLEPAKFSIFNPMLTPYVGVKIQSGQINQLAFNFGYNNDRSNGDVIFQYENLDFVMLNKKNNSKKLVFTFLANTFVIQDENVEGQDDYRKGEILYERDKKKAIFNFWWKSILNGLKSVAVV